MISTRDGSPTLYSERFNQHYHSVHGAIQESQHVFLDMGLRALADRPQLRILEMGFGTGLNALMTALQATMPVHYLSLEAYPISQAQWEVLDYGERLGDQALFLAMHSAPWNVPVQLRPNFILEKSYTTLEAFPGTQHIDLVYWDAFAPDSQPELWTVEVFSNIYRSMNDAGILTTYSAKGDVRRALMAAGFQVAKVPGPPGKREMLRATK
ncbi:MAG: tRNA (5-methylaminomethyl-2-thiouridine)(34)-methyltransferase MnmD [Bacteroidia bacterium]|nr:tRNA (5-methylaminomethyl-2-thiouridine)(34)-methyltransferase MnmD [Bacteroidia bacterium]